MGALLVEVGRATGRGFLEMLAAPFAVTLFEYVVLRDLERVADVIEDGRRLETAGLMAYAFHDPKQLRARELAYQERAGLLPPRDAVIARALDTAARLSAIPGAHEFSP